MKHDRMNYRGIHRTLDKAARAFVDEEDGVMLIIACYFIVIMTFMVGMGADLMRNEMQRTLIQGVADRAVLAAADLDQKIPPEEVVADYFKKSGIPQYMGNVWVSPDSGMTSREVRVTPNAKMKTQFMDTLGVPYLGVPAQAAAIERVNKVEISLVLDISGSMREGDKMASLKEAAGAFFDSVLQEGNEDRVSVSLIPYTAQVNAGPAIFAQLGVNPLHDFSYCVDFEEADFSTVAIDLTKAYEHMQHFQMGSGWNYKGNDVREGLDNISNPTCPKREFEHITSFSQNKGDLKAQVDQFRPRSNTAIHIGMKWAVAMLDPSWNAVNNAIGVDSAFNNRPVNYDDSETIKTIVLMTDGENVATNRIAAERYNTESKINHWSNYPLWYFLGRYVRAEDYGDWYYTKYSPEQADAMLKNICTAAKDSGIIVWTIGLETQAHGSSVMRECASSATHFFEVDSSEVKSAFQTIAHQLNQLKLTL